MSKLENPGSEVLEAQTHLSKQMKNFHTSAALKCALELNIPDVIHKHGKPMSLPELTSALPIHPSKSQHICRLMRFLVTGGFFGEQIEGYALTPVSRILLKDSPVNVKALVFLATDPVLLKPWNFLTDWLKNDDHESPFQAAHGKSFWDYSAQEPRFSEIFNEVMAADYITGALLQQCKNLFEGLTSLVDVGGGTGSVARTISETFHHLKCIVYDLPHVVSNLQGTDNLTFVAGDMLDTIPPANAILLKAILHDWSDENCVKILKNCKKSIPGKDKGGKVIIIEGVIEMEKKAGNGYHELEGLDMEMLVLFNGKERTEREWDKLFSDAGFSDYRIFPVLGWRCIIELSP